MKNEKDFQKEKLLKELMENSNLDQDKLTTAHVISSQDSEKAADAIKRLMNKK